MAGTRKSLKSNPSKVIAITAIFAVLFALGNFIAIPGIASIERIVTFITGVLFGPQITIIAAVVGEAIVMPIAPPGESWFILSVFVGDAIAALVMGYGRKLVLLFKNIEEKNPRKARMIAESIAYVLMLASRYTFYTIFDAIVLYSGLIISPEGANATFAAWTVMNYTRMLLKLLFLPICLAIIEPLRKNLNIIYFNWERMDNALESIKSEGS
ncbi:MAG: hypothetical protein ACTSXU_15035 [Promethearchaeota archaeon]